MGRFIVPTRMTAEQRALADELDGVAARALSHLPAAMVAAIMLGSAAEVGQNGIPNTADAPLTREEWDRLCDYFWRCHHR